MINPILVQKYFEILKSIDYDSKLNEDIEDLEGYEESVNLLNSSLDNVLSAMTEDELKHAIKQAVKRDLLKGQILGCEDEIWDELTEFAEENNISDNEE